MLPDSSITKKELAQRYAPDLKPTAAANRLARWINGDADLLRELTEAGYNPKQRILTPRQARIIEKYIE